MQKIILQNQRERLQADRARDGLNSKLALHSEQLCDLSKNDGVWVPCQLEGLWPETNNGAPVLGEQILMGTWDARRC